MKKAKDLSKKLSNARTDLWQIDDLLMLTQNEIEVSEKSLKVALKHGVPKPKTTSVASATTAISKDKSTQELNQAKNIIDAQRIENFALVQELLNLKTDISSLKAQAVQPVGQVFTSTPSTSTPIPTPSQSPIDTTQQPFLWEYAHPPHPSTIPSWYQVDTE